MAARLRVVRTVKALRAALAGYRSRRATVALVPTMGALHDGHIALVRLARRLARRTAVSVFVNPAQFAPHEDFGRYPRTWKADIAALTAEKADLVFAPEVPELYPEGFATRIAPEGPALAGLEDRFRPHFFGGVATVVAKLLIAAMPDIAIFGEKDYQQLLVIKRLVRDLALPIRIVGGPTVREKDGLALSSRNVYLSPAERKSAPVLHRTLRESALAIVRGDPLAEVMAKGKAAIERAGFAIDYFEARHAETLAPIAGPQEGPIRLLVAAKLGTTRLIDNLGVPRKRG
ncbi:MAG TPA: pantoate--beta-alanine ligase [Xanthobacteraceae bacterium]|nr:pantoate--beta-alanine ligase [Xanthobacteraceae bacterium]